MRPLCIVMAALAIFAKFLVNADSDLTKEDRDAINVARKEYKPYSKMLRQLLKIKEPNRQLQNLIDNLRLRQQYEQELIDNAT